QVFGLLVLNQFIPPSQGQQTTNTIEAGSGGVSTGLEFLSDQMSNWVSQFTNNFVSGVSYKSGNTYTKDELDVLFSKSLFNDRLVIEGNVGYASNPTETNLVGDFN